MTLSARLPHKPDPSVPVLVIPSPRDKTVTCRFCPRTFPRWFWKDGVKHSGMLLQVEHQRLVHKDVAA